MPPGWSSPVVVGDRIYLTAAEPDGDAEYALSALCLSADRRGANCGGSTCSRSRTTRSTHSKNSRASPHPRLRGVERRERDRRQPVRPLRPERHRPPRRRRRPGDLGPHGHRLRTRPRRRGPRPVLAETPDGPVLFFPCDGGSDPFVVALDAATGETRWRKDRPDVGASRTFSFATPARHRRERRTPDDQPRQRPGPRLPPPPTAT